MNSRNQILGAMEDACKEDVVIPAVFQHPRYHSINLQFHRTTMQPLSPKISPILFSFNHYTHQDAFQDIPPTAILLFSLPALTVRMSCTSNQVGCSRACHFDADLEIDCTVPGSLTARINTSASLTRRGPCQATTRATPRGRTPRAARAARPPITRGASTCSAKSSLPEMSTGTLSETTWVGSVRKDAFPSWPTVLSVRDWTPKFHSFMRRYTPLCTGTRPATKPPRRARKRYVELFILVNTVW